MDDGMIARFWSKVDKSGDCWLWTAGTNAAGYGRLGYRDPVGDSRHLFAHRIAWFIANGPVPDGLVIRHSCDIPRCVNPAHLNVGTQAENLGDMFARSRNSPLPHELGERNPAAKLCAEDIVNIRSRIASGESLWSIGVAFGVTRQCITLIKKRVNWAHIP